MLSRLDRAAMAMALEYLRGGSWVEGVTDVLLRGGPGARALAFSYYESAPSERGSDRLCAARCALYLRAVLRADAGDFGRMVCTCFGSPRDVATHRDARHCRAPHPVRYIPLWKLAPPHT